MVQETKWSASSITDARLNQQTLFWGTTQPASGLLADTFWFDTNGGELFQNTGTEGSPTWTSRIKGFVSATAFPGGPSTNDMILRTDINHPFTFDGTNWRSMLNGSTITETYEEDFATDIGWLEQHSANISVDEVTNNRLDFDVKLDDTNDACSVPTTDADFWSVVASNTRWAIEFKVVLTTITQGIDATAFQLAIGFNSLTSASNSETVCDFLGVQYTLGSAVNLLRTMDCNAESITLGQDGSVTLSVASAKTEIIQMIREDATTFTVKVLDSSRVLQAEETRTIEAATNALDNFGLWNLDQPTSGADHTFIGYIDDIKAFNGLGIL